MLLLHRESLRLRSFALCAALAWFVPRISASSVYAANPNSGQLQLVDTVASTATNVFADAASPRGLIFTDSDNIVYTTQTPGELAEFNLSSHTSSVLTTFGPNQIGQFVVLDPGNASVTYGISGGGINRLNLASRTVTGVSTFSDPRGLAYDATGRLFAVLGPGEVAQLNPLTGAVIASITLPSSGSAGANGLAFDPVSGALFVTDDTNDLTARGLYELPTTLSSTTLVNAGLLANGLTADGQGNLWIAEINHSDEFNIASRTLTTGTVNPGMYDVALAPSPVVGTAPEPASLLLIAIGLGALGLSRSRRLN